MARPRKARVEGAEAAVAAPEALPKASDPVPGNNGDALARIVEFFRAEHADEWAAIALCPTQHGLDAMVERLRGK